MEDGAGQMTVVIPNGMHWRIRADIAQLLTLEVPLHGQPQSCKSLRILRETPDSNFNLNVCRKLLAPQKPCFPTTSPPVFSETYRAATLKIRILISHQELASTEEKNFVIGWKA
jgi:hypothetical protein